MAQARKRSRQNVSRGAKATDHRSVPEPSPSEAPLTPVLSLDADELQEIINGCLQGFYRRRTRAIERLRLRKLVDKNPYLYKARGNESAQELLDSLLRDWITSSDETIFGDEFFEPLARKVAERVRGGVTVSDATGIDIVIQTKTFYKAISLKSGPRIFNASAKTQQNSEFISLVSRVRKTGQALDCILGHAYGRAQGFAKGKMYRSSSGQTFWEEITGDADFYQKIHMLMNSEAIRHHRAQYEADLSRTKNRLLLEFTSEYLTADFLIDWPKIVKLNSGKKETIARTRISRTKAP